MGVFAIQTDTASAEIRQYAPGGHFDAACSTQDDPCGQGGLQVDLQGSVAGQQVLLPHPSSAY